MILELAQIGERESPWGWSSTWPESVTSEEAEAILNKFQNFLTEQKEHNR